MIEVIPGILEKDFEEIKRKIELVKNHVSWIHIDIMDNTLVQNDTYNNFASFKQFSSEINFEAHLMVTNPQKYIKPLVENGFKRLITQVEANSIHDFLHEAKTHEIEVGLALDGPSKLEIIEPFLHEIDEVLIMMYKIGASGQQFQQEQLPKIRKIHEEYPELIIGVDGGIDKQTVPSVSENGATRLISTSFLFWKNADRIAEAIEELKNNV